MSELDPDACVGRLIRGSVIDTTSWPTPDEGSMSDAARTRYFQRKTSIALYLSGHSHAETKRRTGLGSKHIYRLITERCLEMHVDGQVYGWRALVPNLRIHPYRRKHKVIIDRFGCGGAGALSVFWDKYPDIRREFDKQILKLPSATKLSESRKSRLAHQGWFLERARRAGCEARGEWPFNTQQLGYVSICRYIDAILAENPARAAFLAGGPDNARKLKAGDGVDRPALRFMERVEMDAHKLDGRFCVSIPLPQGGTSEKIVHRLWVIVLIEVVSRAILGYHLSMGKEVSHRDVLRAIKNALTKWSPRIIAFSAEPYAEGAGLLSALGPQFTGLCWNELSVDGALAETCKTVKGMLRDVVMGEIVSPKNSFAARRLKDDRPFIERFFANLAEGGFQRMTNTTGNSPSHRKGTKPEEIAISSRFQFEYAEELLDVLIANYNATPHKSLSYRSPLRFAEFMLSRSQDMQRYADPNAVQMILSTRKLCKVHGGPRTGRSPFVYFEGATYSSDLLRGRHDLVGKYIWVVNHNEIDARFALASTEDGQQLGILRAAPPWHITPHSLSVRKAVNSLAYRKKIKLDNSDGVRALLDYSERQVDGKLPIHPAYLEARNILIAFAEKSVGETMLEHAMRRAQSPERNDAELQSNQEGTIGASASAPAQSKLPAPRKAATK